MSDNPKMWIGTPGEGDWREVGDVVDFEATAAPEERDITEVDFGAVVTRIQDEIIIETKLTSNVDTLLEMMRKYVGAVTPEQEQLYRSVMVVGTRKLAHVHPGPLDTYGAWWPTKRVDHARARKLYSERLRRDRRRQRKGRVPILRSGPNVRAMFPRVKVEEVNRHGDVFGMRMTTSPHLDAGQVAVFDTQLLDRAVRERPVLQYQEPLKDVARDYLRHHSTLPSSFTNLETS